jgi:hypothetical protein
MYLTKYESAFMPECDAAKELLTSLSNGEVVEVRLVHAPKTAKYSRYKHYHGTLLPAVTDAMGETDKWRVHLMLKRDFLYHKARFIHEIDRRYFRAVGVMTMDYRTLFNVPEHYCIPWSMLTGNVMIVHMGDELSGYVPSLSTLTDEEMKAYCAAVEHRLHVDIGGRK